MDILYISTSFPRPEESSTIYTDLAEELINENHQVTVVVAEEKKKSSITKICNERNMDVLRVVTGNIYDVNILEKGITILAMQHQLKASIKKHLKDKKFDLVLFESPPVTTASVVEWAMDYFKCPSYLMLKDIFPQNAVDIGIMSKRNPAYVFFKYKEKKLYKSASIIGTMSPANQKYVIDHNKFIDPMKVTLFPNTKKVNTCVGYTARDNKFRGKYGIPENSVLAVYGGNMGKPQGIDFLCEILDSNKKNENIFFLLVGRGTEREKIKKYIEKMQIKNALLLNSLPRQKYEEMINEADIGLVFLDSRFTIPNYPSRVLSYFEKKIPVLAAIDENTDFGEMLIDSQSGDYAISNDLPDFNTKLQKLIENPDMRNSMGKSGFEYLNNHLNVKKSVKLLEEQVNSL